MRPIAVFYHCSLSGPHIPDVSRSILILADQMEALKSSGLEKTASEIHIGVNGRYEDGILVAQFCPEKSSIHLHGPEAKSEWSTMNMLRSWISTRPGWAVCYHHNKGVTHPSDLYRAWRKCMERAVILDWADCVRDLDSGFDTAGAHWFRYKDQRYWAGNFWWATSDYLATLPTIPEQHVNGKSYESEAWIGRSAKSPRYSDHAPHAPQTGCRA